MWKRCLKNTFGTIYLFSLVQQCHCSNRVAHCYSLILLYADLHHNRGWNSRIFQRICPSFIVSNSQLCHFKNEWIVAKKLLLYLKTTDVRRIVYSTFCIIYIYIMFHARYGQWIQFIQSVKIVSIHSSRQLDYSLSSLDGWQKHATIMYTTRLFDNIRPNVLHLMQNGKWSRLKKNIFVGYWIIIENLLKSLIYTNTYII